MKLSDALSKYRLYGQEIRYKNENLTQKRDECQKQYELSGNQKWAEDAATIQLSIDANEKAYEKNSKILSELNEQYVAAWNEEVIKQQNDPHNNPGLEQQKIMMVVARMCAGDNVPMKDERKLMEYDGEMYMRAKQAQTIAQSLKKRIKQHDSLWEEDEEEMRDYDPQKAADNTEAQGELPDITISDISEVEIE